MNNFIVAFIVPPMLKAWAWGTYIFFAVWLAVGFVWVWWYVPETKNRTLEEMDRVFGSHTSELDAELMAEAQREVGLTAYLTMDPSAKPGAIESKQETVMVERL